MSILLLFGYLLTVFKLIQHFTSLSYICARPNNLIYFLDWILLQSNSFDISVTIPCMLVRSGIHLSNSSRWSSALLLSCFHIFMYTVVYVSSLQEYKYISGKRLEYFMTSKPLPQHFTVLVRAIPVTNGVSVSDAVDKFFKEYHSSTYLSHTVVHQTGKLRRLLVRFDCFATFYCFSMVNILYFIHGSNNTYYMGCL